MFKSYNNTTENPSSEGSVHSAVIRISTVVAIALSALYLALPDVSGTQQRHAATQPGAMPEHEAINLEAIVHPEPFGLDRLAMNK